MPTPMEIVRKKRSEAVGRMIKRGYLAKKRVYVGQATCEIAAGANDVLEVFQDAIKNGLKDTYLSTKGCAGRCNLEPMVEIIEKDCMPVKYCRVTKERAEEIVRRHLIGGEVIDEWKIV